MVSFENFETFDLVLLKAMASACEGCRPSFVHTGSFSCETLRIAKGQAHADLGVEYIEWEPCNIEITSKDGSIIRLLSESLAPYP